MKLDQSSDEELLSLYCKGDHSAFEALYTRHRDSLYRFILRQNNNMTSYSEEVFQDVWTNVINNKRQFRYDSKFTTWLYQITRNKLIDKARKSISRKDIQHDSFDNETIHSSNLQPEEKSQIEICIELLQKYVLQLPDEQKEAFVLKHETEKSIEELAIITKTTHETFKSRLRYAMKKLRDRLPGDCL